MRRPAAGSADSRSQSCQNAGNSRCLERGRIMKAASICRRCAGLLKAAMLGGIVFAVSSAPAQQQMTQAEIRACLCQQEAMNALRLKQAEDQNFFQRASPLERQLTEQI